MRLFLLGFMGSGKTYTGKRLADRLNMPFIDLDDWIEKRQGRSISQLFSDYGEAAFRQMEKEALHSLIDYKRVVIACGGGTPCFFDNIIWMNQFGISIYLQASPELLYQRLISETSHRPLLKGKKETELLQFLSAKLEERVDFYNQASVVLNQDDPGPPADEALFLHLKDIIGH
ncbi:MAG: shikimate kinase [Saprospiraceae bacterium]|nr:MAG: shikimate kinase [Saprospiraceae bacterium]